MSNLPSDKSGDPVPIPTEAAPAPSRGEPFGRYFLLELIGKGGMAEVFRAVSHGVEGFQRVFVVKRILREKSASKDFVEMFINEARISAMLNHPNIVQVYDFGQIDGSFFLSMEHLQGKDLLSLLRELRAKHKPMPPELAAYITQQVATGLHHAHSLQQHGGKALNIVHRDVSPSNIMLLRAGGVKLLDFGIAKAETATDTAAPTGTQAGAVKGKLSYLSPEQIRNEPLDGRSDVYSLGVVLWECLTGKRLFYDRTDFQTMKNVLERPVAPPSMQRFDLPPQLDYIVVRALERDLSQRYPNAKAMAEDLESFLQQSHFSPGALPRLLNDLFGEEKAEVEDNLPLASPPGSSDALEVPGGAQSRSGIATGTVSETGALGSGSTRPAGPPKRKTGAIIGAAATVIVLGGAGVFALTRSVPAEPPHLAALPIKAVPAPAAVPPPPVSTPETPAPSGPTLVSIRLQTEPAGAEVRGPGDTVLGVTPTTAQFAKATDPVILSFVKPGFLTSRHAIVPDRDVTALVTLRALPRGKAGAAGKQPWRTGKTAAILDGKAEPPVAPSPASEIKIVEEKPAESPPGENTAKEPAEPPHAKPAATEESEKAADSPPP